MKRMLKRIDNKYVRLVAFIIVVVNASLKMMGIDLLPFNNEQLIAGVSIVGVVVIGAWNFWKNNSFTDLAKKSDKWLASMRDNVEDQLDDLKGDDKK